MADRTWKSAGVEDPSDAADAGVSWRQSRMGRDCDRRVSWFEPPISLDSFHNAGSGKPFG